MRRGHLCLFSASMMLGACGGAGESDPGRSATERSPGTNPARLPDGCEPSTSPGGDLLVDDFEDGDELLDGGANLHGAWYVENDGTGEQSPPAGPEHPNGSLLAAPGAPGSPQHALHTSGGGFQDWGAFVAVRLNASRFAPCTYDISRSSGLRLSVKGAGDVRFNLGTVSTTPADDRGECRTDTCSDYGSVIELGDEWQRVELPFDALTQPEWATPAELDLARALRLSFWAPKDGFDLWLDDVRFYE